MVVMFLNVLKLLKGPSHNWRHCLTVHVERDVLDVGNQFLQSSGVFMCMLLMSLCKNHVEEVTW